MKFRRTLALLLTLCCLLSLLPPVPASAATHSRLLEQIEPQYDAFAASIAQPSADDDALEQLLNHALRGNHKTLNMDSSDPMTACAFGSVLFREAVTNAIAYGIEALVVDKKDHALMSISPNWYENKSVYRVVELEYNTTADYEDDATRHVLISSSKPSGKLNRNDEALTLVVGSSRGRIWLDRDPADPSRYHVRVTLLDRFDFNQSMASAMVQFNGSLASLLNILGPLMGFKSFDWYSTVEFDLELPEVCSHETGTFRWEASGGNLVPVSGSGLSEIPLQVHTVPAKNNLEETLYYELDNPVALRHTDPWVMEFRYKGKTSLAISAQRACYMSRPYFYRSSDGFFAGQALIEDPDNPNSFVQARHYYGIQTTQIHGAEWHTFRVENRIDQQGANMLWLLIDGQEVGPLDNYSIRDASGTTTDQGIRSDWANGKDFLIRFIGNYTYPLRGELEYFALWQNSQPTAPELTDPTCTQPGARKEHCPLCGLVTKQENTPALGHDLKTVAGQAPTCEAPGYTDSQVCARCWETVTATQTLPALGHSPAAVPGKEPLCQAEGLSEGSVCSVCAKTLTPQQSIPALGHSYENGLCARCAQQDPTLIPGDANGDGIANYQDALTVLRVSIDLEPMQPVYLLLCDMDKNGTLNYADALLILRHSIGLGNSEFKRQN